MKFRARTNRVYKAFTLVEMSVVLLILAVLISGVVAGAKMIKRSRIASAQSMTTKSPVAKIENLVLWLEPVTDESFKEIETQKNNKEISAWFDLNPDSPKNDATPSTPTSAPFYQKNGINNLPAINFQTGKFLIFSSDKLRSKLVSSNLTIFVVEKRLSASNSNYFISSVSGDFKVGYKSDTAITFQAGSGCIFSTPASSVPSFVVDKTPKIHVFRLRSNSGSVMEYTRLADSPGLRQAAVTANCTPPSNLSALIIGSNAGVYYENIGEIIIYNRSLKDTEKADVENYLSAKWKIQEN